MTLITLSDVNLPWDANQHPNAALVEEMVVSFIYQFGLNTEYFVDTNTLFALLHPSTSSNRLLVVGKVYALCWFLDDFWDGNLSQEFLESVGISYERRYELIREIAATIQTGNLANNAAYVVRGFYEVWQDLLQSAPKTWLEEFAKTMVESLITSHQSETGMGLLESFDDYLTMRDKDAGGIYTCLLMEYTNEIFLSSALRNHPVIKTLRTVACRVGGLGNDLVSYHKEKLQNEIGYNALSFLMDKDGIPFEAAVRRVIEKHNQLVEEFLRLEESIDEALFPDDLKQVLSYIQGLKEIMTGTWEWELTTMRYRTDNALFPELERERGNFLELTFEH